MSWFKVDDKFYSHAKTVRIPRAERAEAIGTWTLCGTWSADHELDGFVPDYMVEEQGGTLAGAESLVAVGLWKRTKRRGGFQFVNWSEWQPTRAEKVESRKAESQRKAAYRARKARESGGESGDVPVGQVPSPDTPSRPVPRTEVSQVPASSQGDQHERRDDLSPVVASVVDVVGAVCRRAISPLVVWDIVDFLETRRGPHAKPLQNPARYYARAIEGSPAEVQQFIDTKGLAS